MQGSKASAASGAPAQKTRQRRSKGAVRAVLATRWAVDHLHTARIAARVREQAKID